MSSLLSPSPVSRPYLFTLSVWAVHLRAFPCSCESRRWERERERDPGRLHRRRMPCNDAAHPGRRLEYSSPRSPALLASLPPSSSAFSTLRPFYLVYPSRLPRWLLWRGTGRAAWAARGARGGVIALEKRLLFLRPRCIAEGREVKKKKRERERKRPDSSKGLVITFRHTIGGMHASVSITMDRKHRYKSNKIKRIYS